MTPVNAPELPDLSHPELVERSENASVFGYNVAELSELILRNTIIASNLDGAQAIQEELAERPDLYESRTPRLSSFMLKMTGREDEVLSLDEHFFKNNTSFGIFSELATEMLETDKEKLEVRQKEAQARFSLYSERAKDEASVHHKSASEAETNIYEEMPQFLRDAYESNAEENGANVGLFEWLAGKPDSKFGATDEQLTNLLQWHTDKYEKINADSETRAMFERGKAAYAGRLQKLIDIGLFPEEMIDRLESYGSENMYVGDDLSFTMDKIGHEVGGRIVVGKDYDQLTLDHELNHAILQSEEDMETWYFEAITEILAVMMQPKREQLNSEYHSERKLFFAFIDSGLIPLNLPLAYQAYAERGEDRTKRDMFAAQIQAVYPWTDDVFRDLSEHLSDPKFKNGGSGDKFESAKQWLQDQTAEYKASSSAGSILTSA